MAHHIYLNHLIKEAIAGKHKMILVSLPPQHGKSTFISYAFPVWLLSEMPDTRVVLTSYEADFAASFGARVRRALRDNPHVFHKKLDKDTDKYFTLEGHSGSMQCAGTLGPITGKSADVLIIDDPVKNAEQAMSITHRQKTWDWFLSTAYPRLSENGIVIVVMTRWHPDDLAGRLIEMCEKTGKPLLNISLPALAEENDPLGREVGEPLAPELFSKKRLLEIKRALGTVWWDSLYGGNPKNAMRQIVRRTWWQRCPILPASFEFILQSWDTALKEEEQNDNSACTTWGVGRLGIYLIDVYEEKLEYPELKAAIKHRASRFNPNIILIEDKGSGTSVSQDLRMSTRLPIEAWPVEGGNKTVRLNLVASVWESGRVFIPEGPDFDALIEEMAEFPKVKHDDKTDSASQAMSFYKQKLMNYTADEGAAVERLTRGSRRDRAQNGFF